MTTSPQRILLVRLSHLGDVVHALPVYHALRLSHPGAALAWAIQPEYADLALGLPGLDRVLTFERRRGLRAWPRLRRALAAYAPDWTVDAQGNMKSAAVTLLSGAKRRSGLHSSLWRERHGARVLNDASKAWDSSRTPHAFDISLHLARHVAPGVPLDALLDNPLGLRQSELERGRARFAHFFPDPHARPVILQLAAAGDVRAWPIEHQIALLRQLHERGRTALALSGPDEGALGARVRSELAAWAHVQHWVGQRGLRELAAFFTCASERGARFVSCDSGPLHLASACGLPVLGLAGPQDERRTGPWPVPGPDTTHSVLRATTPLYCAPCNSRRCFRTDGVLCMAQITPTAVLERLSAI